MLGDSAGRAHRNPIRTPETTRRTEQQRIDAGPYPEDQYESLDRRPSKLIWWGSVLVLVGIALLCLGVALSY